MLSEKVAYLKGLCEGMKINESTDEGKLLVKIIEVLEDISVEVTAAADNADELQTQIDEIDEDLSFVEDYLFEDDDEDFDDDDYDLGDIECPYCGEEIYLDASVLESDEDTLTCPACGKEFDLEFEDCCCDECSAGCDCGCDDKDEE